jgi:hypothetical protein
MRRFVEGIDRGQATLFPEYLEDWIDADNPVRVIDAFVDKLDPKRTFLHEAQSWNFFTKPSPGIRQPFDISERLFR